MCELEGYSQEPFLKVPSLYTLEEINGFLDDTTGRQVNIKNFSLILRSLCGQLLFIRRMWVLIFRMRKKVSFKKAYDCT